MGGNDAKSDPVFEQCGFVDEISKSRDFFA